MIKFEIVIQEETNGQLRITAKTPPGVASPLEIAMGLKFKKLVADLSLLHGCRTDTAWAHPNNEIGGEN